MPDIEQEINERDIEELISELCDIIFAGEDVLDIEKTFHYIEHLTPKEIRKLKKNGFSEKYKIRTIVIDKVLQYVRKYKSNKDKNLSYPFAFDSDGGFTVYCVLIEDYYRIINRNNALALPSLLSFTLNLVQEISDQYRFFGEFYKIQFQDTEYDLLTSAKKNFEEQMEDALKTVKTASEKAVEDATKDAKVQAEVAVAMAKEASTAAKTAACEEADSAVTEKMNELMAKVSESNVTILGIFAGIVLTIVGGLIYSSSVLESVSSTNIHKLFIIATIVGFVCINIIAIMFDYITKIRERNSEEDNQSIMLSKEWIKKNIIKHLFIINIDAILIVIMIFAAITYKPEKNINTNQPQYDANISVDVNVPTPNEVTPISTTPEATPTEALANTLSITPVPSEDTGNEDTETEQNQTPVSNDDML